MAQPLFDTHCHLHAEVFDRDRSEVIDRARARGVRRVLSMGEDLQDCWRLLLVAEQHPDFVVPALGIHPDRAPHVRDAEVADVLELIERFRDRLGAVGEVGLDHRPCWDAKARGRQAEVFQAMIRLAGRLGLPLSVHSRGAGHSALDILRQEKAPLACLHAFDGRAIYAEQGAKDGYFFSIPPSVVRSQVKRKMVSRLEAARLLLETDSPVLGPDPTVRNEPGNLLVALEEVARLRRIDKGRLASVLASNTEAVFPRLVQTPALGEGTAPIEHRPKSALDLGTERE